MESPAAFFFTQIALAVVALSVGACSTQVPPKSAGTDDFDVNIVQVTNPVSGKPVSEIRYCDNAPPVVLRIQMRNLTNFRARWVQLSSTFGLPTTAILPNNYRNFYGLVYGETTTTSSGRLWSGYVDISINGSARSISLEGEQYFGLSKVTVDDQNPQAGFGARTVEPQSVQTEPFSHRRMTNSTGCNFHQILDR